MKRTLAILVALCLVGVAQADVWKITHRQQRSVWAVTETGKPAQVVKGSCSDQCSCGCNAGKSCQCGNSSVVPAGGVSVTSSCANGTCATGASSEGSCANGSCGTSSGRSRRGR